MPSENVSLAILFADISQSTQLYETLGDKAAQELVSKCISFFSALTNEHQGTVLKTIGDEVMCTFPDANLAVRAAISMQQAIEEMPVPKAEIYPPYIRVGIHFGSVIQKGKDIFGDSVNLAARLVSLAKPRQILTTEQTKKKLLPNIDATIRRIDTTTVKGKRKELNIYEVIWEQQDVTVIAEEPPPSISSISRLKMRYGNQVIELDGTRPVFTMGRHRDNDLSVDDILASRTHARIEYRRGRFVLLDQSTNGTYVFTKGHGNICIRRDELLLHGGGIICLGHPVKSDSPSAIHFECES
jgi:adenylate cyclase